MKKLNARGHIHLILPMLVILVIITVGAYVELARSRAVSPTPVSGGSGPAGSTAEIKSALSGNWCVNDKGGSLAASAPINTAKCDGTAQQHWKYANNHLEVNLPGNNPEHCLEPQSGGTTSGTPVVMDTCNGHPAQNWNLCSGNFVSYNQSCSSLGSELCLAAPGGTTGVQLLVRDCDLTNNAQAWQQAWFTPVIAASACGNGSGTEGDQVASCALKELNAWNASGSNHGALIAKYCDGSGACEAGEWCAGFVSYIYKESGHSFGQVNVAYSLENLKGFTFHTSSSYKPQLGDVQISTGSGAGHAQTVVDTNGPTLVSGNSGNAVIKTTAHSGTVYGYVSPN